MKARLGLPIAAILLLSSVFGIIALRLWPPGNPRIPGRPITAALLAANSRYKFHDAVYRRGTSIIHRLDETTAHRIEDGLYRVALHRGLPAFYLAAFVLTESTGDPRAEYRNPASWEAARDDRQRVAATDYGLVQISGRNLLEMAPNDSLAALVARAQDIDFSLNYLADYLARDLEWAQGLHIDKIEHLVPAIRQRAQNPFWLAALAYNRGRAGALAALDNTRACRHAERVITAWEEIEARASSPPNQVARAPRFPDGLDFTGPLMTGDIGPRVEALQRLLNERTTPPARLTVDGNFGPATRDALLRFQNAHGLAPTGAADAPTWAALGPRKPPPPNDSGV